MRIASGFRSQLPDRLPGQLGRYRHRVFIQRLGWQIAAAPHQERHLEQDQFDQQDTVYVIALTAAGQVCGCARLISTTQPTLMREIFPHLMQDALPHSHQVWELSRFASDSPAITRHLLDAVLHCAAELGIQRLIALSPLAVERLLKRWGIDTQRAGVPTQMAGKWICARWIDVPPLTYTLPVWMHPSHSRMPSKKGGGVSTVLQQREF